MGRTIQDRQLAVLASCDREKAARNKAHTPTTCEAALAAGQGIVRQANLNSTASEADRSATIDRFCQWWNYIALPALESAGIRTDKAEACRAVDAADPYRGLR
jgi:hypothetical protein